MVKQELSIFWFRRDLRLEDNHGLYKALTAGDKVLGLFIFDKEILDKLPAKDARVQFIHQELSKIKADLEEIGSSLLVRYGKVDEVWQELSDQFTIKTVFANRDYESYAIARDKRIYYFLEEQGIPFKAYKDHVIFEKSEVVKDDGKPYVVYTPYMKRYKQLLSDEQLRPHLSESEKENFIKTEALPFPGLAEMGFQDFPFQYPSAEFPTKIIQNYHEQRDIPAIKGTSRLSLHLRFGTVSIRALVKHAMAENDKYFNELIWRDFYQSIIYHFPHSEKESFRREYDAIEWENNSDHFEKWCVGKTGYPLVDAGMRELNETGFMHNRVRMVVASFLTKHLLIDWRWGENYFAEKLLDYELASNVGGWQWAAGSGVDAAPYFRVFNPSLQMDKFDPEKRYIKKWVPEFGTSQYPKPIVDHKEARLRAIARYKQTLNPSST
jgi:deoxyribodipyrimidine photo-lyase